METVQRTEAIKRGQVTRAKARTEGGGVLADNQTQLGAFGDDMNFITPNIARAQGAEVNSQGESQTY